MQYQRNVVSIDPMEEQKLFLSSHLCKDREELLVFQEHN